MLNTGFEQKYFDYSCQKYKMNSEKALKKFSKFSTDYHCKAGGKNYSRFFNFIKVFVNSFAYWTLWRFSFGVSVFIVLCIA